MQHKCKEWLQAVGEIDHCVLCNSNYMLQVAHNNQGRGKGQKAPDWETARLCGECHHDIDNGHTLSKFERRSLLTTAIVRTHSILIQSGKMLELMQIMNKRGLCCGITG